MSASLRARLDRLERQQRSQSLPRLVFGLRGAEDADVIAYDGNGVVTLRGDNEPLTELQERAFALSGAIVLTARYREEARQALAELEEAARPALSSRKAENAADGPQIATSDPFELAGIGRRATREELIRMGAIHVSPEQLI